MMPQHEEVAKAVHRLMVQIEEQTYERLRRRAALERQSMASVVRRALEEHLTDGAPRVWSLTDFAFVASGESDRPDVGRRHDEELGRILWEEHATSRQGEAG